MNNNAPTMSMHIINELITCLTDEQLERQIMTADFLCVFEYERTSVHHDAYQELIVLCKGEQERRIQLAIRRSEVDIHPDDLPF